MQYQTIEIGRTVLTVIME